MDGGRAPAGHRVRGAATTAAACTDAVGEKPKCPVMCHFGETRPRDSGRRRQGVRRRASRSAGPSSTRPTTASTATSAVPSTRASAGARARAHARLPAPAPGLTAPADGRMGARAGPDRRRAGPRRGRPGSAGLGLLLFLQWPLRDLVQAYSREANDLAQMLFALYVSLADHRGDTRTHGHIAADALAQPLLARGHARLSAHRRAVRPRAVVALRAVRGMADGRRSPCASSEAFPETYNPGYFVLKTGGAAAGAAGTCCRRCSTLSAGHPRDMMEAAGHRRMLWRCAADDRHRPAGVAAC